MYLCLVSQMSNSFPYDDRFTFYRLSLVNILILYGKLFQLVLYEVLKDRMFNVPPDYGGSNISWGV